MTGRQVLKACSEDVEITTSVSWCEYSNNQGQRMKGMTCDYLGGRTGFGGVKRGEEANSMGVVGSQPVHRLRGGNENCKGEKRCRPE